MSFAERVRQISDYLNQEHKQHVLYNMSMCVNELLAMLEREIIDELIIYKETTVNIYFDANEDTLYCSTYNRKTIDRKGAVEMICKSISPMGDFNISFEKHNRRIIAENVEAICNEAIRERFDGLTTKISYQDWMEIHYQLNF